MNSALEISTIISIIGVLGNIILFCFNRKISYKNIEIQEKNQEISKEISKSNLTLKSLENQKERINTYISHNRVEWMQLMKKYITEYLEEIYKYDIIKKEDLDKYLQTIKLKTVQIKLHLNYLGNADKNILKEIYDLNRILELKFMEDKIQNICSDCNEEVKKETIMTLRNVEYYYYMQTGCDAFEIKRDIWKQVFYNDGETRKDIKEIYLKEISKFNEFLSQKPQIIILYVEVYLKTEWERVKYEIENGNYKNYEFDYKYNENLKKISKDIDRIKEFIKEKIT